MQKATIIEIIALLFVILFLYTGIAKLMDYNLAKEQIRLTPLLAPISNEIVIILPIIEIIVAILLFLPGTREIGFLASFALMLAFTGYVVYILNLNTELPCTCGGILQQMTWTQHLTFNITFIILSLIGLMLSKRVKMNHSIGKTTSLDC